MTSITAVFGKLDGLPVTDQHGRLVAWVRLFVPAHHAQHVMCTLPPEVTAQPAANSERYA